MSHLRRPREKFECGLCSAVYLYKLVLRTAIRNTPPTTGSLHQVKGNAKEAVTAWRASGEGRRQVALPSRRQAHSSRGIGCQPDPPRAWAADRPSAGRRSVSGREGFGQQKLYDRRALGGSLRVSGIDDKSPSRLRVVRALVHLLAIA